MCFISVLIILLSLQSLIKSPSEKGLLYLAICLAILKHVIVTASCSAFCRVNTFCYLYSSCVTPRVPKLRHTVQCSISIHHQSLSVRSMQEMQRTCLAQNLTEYDTSYLANLNNFFNLCKYHHIISTA